MKNIEKAEESKRIDIEKFKKNPHLMAFTMKHRILNSVAFRQYRTLFFIIQSKYSFSYIDCRISITSQPKKQGRYGRR